MVRSLTLLSFIVTTLYSNHNSPPMRIGLSLWLGPWMGIKVLLYKTNDMLVAPEKWCHTAIT